MWPWLRQNDTGKDQLTNNNWFTIELKQAAREPKDDQATLSGSPRLAHMTWWDRDERNLKILIRADGKAVKL